MIDEEGKIIPEGKLFAISFDGDGNEKNRSAFKIVRIDAREDVDLVLLKTERDMSPEIPPLGLANKRPDNWEKVYVIGNPLGVTNVIFTGRVAKNTYDHYPSLMWLDIAGLYPGNSGSGVYNNRGELIGIFQVPLSSEAGQLVYLCGGIETIKKFLDKAPAE